MSKLESADTANAGVSTLLSRIQAMLAQLRRSEKKVADLVLARPHAIVHAPIAAVAEQAGVSEPTVIRFCRTLGYTGFQKFKLELARSLASGVPYVLQGVSPNETTEDLSAKVIERSIATLVQVRNHLSTVHLQEAIEILANASRIEFYGHGASGIVAADAQHKFFRLGMPTVAYSDPHVHSMSAAILPEDAAVVAISHTGRSRDLIQSVDLALEDGVKVIGITAAGSPLAERCTISLFADVHEDTDIYTPMTSRIAHLAIIDVLSVGVALRRGPDLVHQLERTKAKLRDKRIDPIPR
ncbi:MAG TPA: transcriptional regulator HexR [Gammaproteobacteria bacterium]|nr:transcriptional regulator HexR [Gammaproteobacteria bacterium]